MKVPLRGARTWGGCAEVHLVGAEVEMAGLVRGDCKGIWCFEIVVFITYSFIDLCTN